MPKNWLATTLRGALWAATRGSPATTNLSIVPGKMMAHRKDSIFVQSVIEIIFRRKSDGSFYRFICHGLVTGEKYVFRVRAVNAAGLSQFSPESEPVEVKAAIGERSSAFSS